LQNLIEDNSRKNNKFKNKKLDKPDKKLKKETLFLGYRKK
jgi:hypothetical protein